MVGLSEAGSEGLQAEGVLAMGTQQNGRGLAAWGVVSLSLSALLPWLRV